MRSLILMFLVAACADPAYDQMYRYELHSECTYRNAPATLDQTIYACEATDGDAQDALDAWISACDRVTVAAGCTVHSCTGTYAPEEPTATCDTPTQKDQ